MAVKARFKGTAWTRWAQDIRLRWQNALDYYRRELYYDIEFHSIPSVQIQPAVEKTKILCQCQRNPHHRGHSHLLAMDSADTWAHPELFELDRDNIPTAVCRLPS